MARPGTHPAAARMPRRPRLGPRHGSVAVISAAALAVAGCGDGGHEPGEIPVATAPAASTALPVSRRADPSIDRYTFTAAQQTPADAMNDAQRWISTHARPFVAHDSDPRVSENITGWGSRPDVHVYVNATGVNRYDTASLREAEPWLVEAGGDPVFVDDWRKLDLREPAARRWWLLGSDGKATCNDDRDVRAALDLIACGYTGLWLDNVFTNTPGRFGPDPGIDAGAWGDAVVALLTELRAGLPKGVPFTINAHWTETDFPTDDDPELDPESAFVRAAKLADQLVIEGGAIDAGLNYPAGPEVPYAYARQLDYVDALHAQGVAVQWEKVGSEGLTGNAIRELGALPACSDSRYDRPAPAFRRGSAAWRGHVRTAGFNLASALLTHAAGDGVGDICEYPGRGFDGYGVELGAARGSRTIAGGLHVRAFARGYVAVNASMAPADLRLPDGRAGVDVAARTQTPSPPASVFRLPPRTAAIVRYAGA